VDVAVEFLLAGGEFAPADVLRAEMGGQRVEDNESHRAVAVGVFAGDIGCSLGQQHLVIGVEGPSDMDILQKVDHKGVHRRWIVGRTVDPTTVELGVDNLAVESANHIVDPLWPKGVLGVDKHGSPGEAPVFLWQLYQHRQLVAELGFADAEPAVNLGHRLGFDTAAEEFVDGFDAGREFSDPVAVFTDRASAFEAPNAGGLPSSSDNVGRGAVADIGGCDNLSWASDC